MTLWIQEAVLLCTCPVHSEEKAKQKLKKKATRNSNKQWRSRFNVLNACKSSSHVVSKSEGCLFLCLSGALLMFRVKVGETLS